MFLSSFLNMTVMHFGVPSQAFINMSNHDSPSVSTTHCCFPQALLQPQAFSRLHLVQPGPHMSQLEHLHSGQPFGPTGAQAALIVQLCCVFAGHPQRAMLLKHQKRALCSFCSQGSSQQVPWVLSTPKTGESSLWQEYEGTQGPGQCSSYQFGAA